MKRVITIAVAVFAYASGALAAPGTCTFGQFDDSATSVDIGAMYKAADVVMVGTVGEHEGGNIMLRKDAVLKGLVGQEDIVLRSHKPFGTEVNGFVLPGGRQVLVFLKAGNSGVYDNVEEYNSACNRLWLVNEGSVLLIGKDAYNEEYSVPVGKLKEYLESAPAQLVYKYK